MLPGHSRYSSHCGCCSSQLCQSHVFLWSYHSWSLRLIVPPSPSSCCLPGMVAASPGMVAASPGWTLLSGRLPFPAALSFPLVLFWIASLLLDLASSSFWTYNPSSGEAYAPASPEHGHMWVQNALEFSNRYPIIAQKDHNGSTEEIELVAPKACHWVEPEVLILSAEVLKTAFSFS